LTLVVYYIVDCCALQKLLFNNYHNSLLLSGIDFKIVNNYIEVELNKKACKTLIFG